ncbi:hypothetical protein [Nocardioides sp. T2.26MG-1]|uniref:hypothetical protein n=1 Tax=Nocardioides sp. T2.26MG-1 TaxID=3041166 RepID=UPI00253F6C9B|nr:hypothetical protein [Nocardioides sp. T2.26MG-1]
MQGRRLPDTPAGRLPDAWEPGDFWKVLTADGARPVTPEEYSGAGRDYSGNLTGTVWFVVTPNGLLGGLSLHTVREHEDSTISIRPGDGSSNSVLIEGAGGKSWHGYVEHGVWRAC